MLKLIAMLLWLTMVDPFVTARCLNQTVVKRPRYFFPYDQDKEAIKLESSTRTSHLLANSVLKILLEEVVGYAEVYIATVADSINATKVMNRIAGCTEVECRNRINSSKTVPVTMVNLEVWMMPGFNVESWVSSGYLIDCGPLGPNARFGWFQPTYMVIKFWKEKKLIVDHWRAFQEYSISEQYSLKSQRDRLRQLVKSGSPTDPYHCQDTDCVNGILYGPGCNTTNEDRCALLFSSTPELDMGILKKQIINFQMHVNIAWIGNNLTSYVTEQIKLGNPILFFSWQPNTFTAYNFTRMKFPLCTETQHGKPIDCDFEINQLTKVVWSRLKRNAPEAFHLINNIEFKQQTYQDIIDKYRDMEAKRSSIQAHEVACEWVRENKDIWKHWIPPDLTNKTKIYLGGMFPLTGRHWTGPGLLPAVHMATDAINQNSTILSDYSLEVLVTNTQCVSKAAMKAFISYVTNTTHKIAGILGPACSEAAKTVASMATPFNTIVLSYGAEYPVLSKSKDYPNFFRTVPHIGQHGLVYAEAFKVLGWTRVGLLIERDVYSFMQHSLESFGINVVEYINIPKTHSFDASQYLQKIKEKNVKILIGDYYDYAARAIMCHAYQMGMTAKDGYQWFLPGWLTGRWWDTDRYNSHQKGTLHVKENVPCTTAEMDIAVNGYMMLSKVYYDEDSAWAVGNVTVGQWKKNYRKLLNETTETTDMRYAGYAYDAVWVYAFALDKLIKHKANALQSIRKTETLKLFIDYMNQTDFKGVTGHLSMSGANRTGITYIQQFYSGNITTVGRYVPTRGNKKGRLKMELKLIKWLNPSGTQITDGRIDPELCDLEAFRQLLGVSCHTAIVIVNVMSFGGVFLMLTLVLLLYKRKYDKKVRATRARMEELGLLNAKFDWMTLDEWEMQREKVVLNRKLGEGAFGTVYGGEAYILSDHNWGACAVKTLKVGSTPQEKLDFLTEAEMMKRFDHQNIVKLLGVCTRGEPTYAIMEFMLYGDLKTYLLARRHLVSKPDPDNEISPQRLTQMALDISLGLEYLATMKYVHRDLACRNCLVGTDRVAKIGDFGMTRPMSDADYYRFSRKGMLPVRWMAPESLGDGIFTSQSDVWSFGVLLYEILTFGSFPYQGLSNNQVLEYVKDGNTLTLPQGCTPELRKLIGYCWSYRPEMRPSAANIVGYLEQNPGLVTPSLDAPVAAVPVEGVGALEIVLPSRNKNPTSRSFSGSASAGFLLGNIPTSDSRPRLKNPSGDTSVCSNSVSVNSDNLKSNSDIRNIVNNPSLELNDSKILNNYTSLTLGSNSLTDDSGLKLLSDTPDKMSPLNSMSTIPLQNIVSRNCHNTSDYNSDNDNKLVNKDTLSARNSYV
ncbi:uncharacterized protein LOC141914425 [Tubulanus polymorphus]|uniref:uncharacterized protein LOC141901613 n=1 Tax=Tubulanus polymorphus TaxID=672921 RepID=UPI003DA21C50